MSDAAPPVRRGLARERLILLLAAAAFTATFSWTYHVLVTPTYDYFGFGWSPRGTAYTLLSWVLVLIPPLWMPIRLRRPSQLLLYIQYFFIFVPASVVLWSADLPELPTGVALELLLLCFAGLTVMQAVYLLPLPRVRLRPVSRTLFAVLLGAVLLGLAGYLAATIGGSFRIVNLVEIYDLRAQLEEFVTEQGSRFIYYAQLWLSGFVLPLCFAFATYGRRRSLLLVVGAGYIFLFGVGGAKTSLFALVYLPLMYLLLRASSRRLATGLAVGLTLLLAGAMLIPESLRVWYVALVHLRTFSVPPLLIAQYYDFFQSHPLTYLSHVNGINLLIPYPYEGDIPRTIGMYYYDVPMGANAGVWAGDGLAAFGPPGIVLMSFAAAAVFYLFDLTARRHDPRFVLLAATQIATAYANVPLSTTLLSGGMLFLMIALLVLPPVVLPDRTPARVAARLVPA